MLAHRKVCIDCQRAKRDPYAFCGEGWDMAKRESRANYQLRKFADPHVPGQGELF